MRNKKIIEIDAAIYPRIMTVTIGESINNGDLSEVEVLNNIEPEIMIELPRGAYLLYLQKAADDCKTKEMELLKKYSTGAILENSDYSELLDILMTALPRKWSRSMSDENFLAPFGVFVEKDDAGKMRFALLEDAVEYIRRETWEGIIIDILRSSAMDIISCFDFDASYTRIGKNPTGSDLLHFSLGSWGFTSDEAEQKLSTALRVAFMFTLVGYQCGDRKMQYSSFVDYFEAEFYKRVSLVYGIWISKCDKTKVEYIPLYDSFHNLNRTSKSELIEILKSILDNENIALDEKQTLKAQLIDSTGKFHANISSTNTTLEQTLIKPAINLIMLREKSKETMESAEILCKEAKYSDCANRCYYAMMCSLKTLLENQGKLANWEKNKLKENETHKSLEKGLKELVSEGVLDAGDQANFEYVKDQRWKCDYSLYSFQKTDAEHCLRLVKNFYTKVENIIS